jgi:diacylglycerol kinase (ATP)
MPFSVRSRIGSFRHAFRGVATLLRTQHNAWLHLAATVIVVVFGVFLGISRLDWIAVILAIGIVWSAEALNTSIEFLADEVSLDKRELIGQAKDLGAAGVLVASIAAFLTGLFVFIPYIRIYLAQYRA